MVKNGCWQAVLFDFDGTLVDASEAICRSFNGVLERNGVPAMHEKSVREMIGMPLRAMFSGVFPDASDAHIEVCIDQYRETFMPLSKPLSRPMPGLETAIPHLARHVKLGIVTSRTVRGAVHILEGFGLIQYFPSIIGIDVITNSKPHPEPVLKALSELETEPKASLMVGDTADDMKAAVSAGVTAVGITSDPVRRQKLQAAGAARVIVSLDELRELTSAPDAFHM